MQKNNVHEIKDGWLRVIGTPIVAYMNVFITSIWEPLLQQVPFYKPYIVNIVVVAITWNVCRVALIWSRIKYPDMKTFVKRMIIAYITYFFITLTIVSTYCLLINITKFYGVILPFSYLGKYMVIGMSQVAVVAAIYEAIYFFWLWKQSVQYTEKLKRETLQTQLDSVRGQINPGFLFSNLDTLKSMIQKKDKASAKFVDELSQVYRYVLQGTEKQLTELCDELKFVQTYEHLLRERYGDDVLFEINVPDEYRQLRIPTLTMQILIENALKNSTIATGSPLHMKFSANEKQSLTVSNSLFKKPEDTIQKVLNNIKDRYEILGVAGLKIERTESECKIILPLLN